MRYHLAQQAYRPGQREVIAMLVKFKEDVRDLTEWADFQDAYAKAIADGANPDEALAIANKPSFQR